MSDGAAVVGPRDAERRSKLAQEAGEAALAEARQQLYRSQLRREVKQLVDEYLPTIETNSAQTDEEVVELLLRQIGYPPAQGEEVVAAWQEGVRAWRAVKATEERHLGAVRGDLTLTLTLTLTATLTRSRSATSAPCAATSSRV